MAARKQNSRPERSAGTLPNQREQPKPAVTFPGSEKAFGPSLKTPTPSRVKQPSVFPKRKLSPDRPSYQKHKSFYSIQGKFVPISPWNQGPPPNVEQYTDDDNIFESASEDDQEQIPAAPVDQGIPAVGQSSSEESEATENDRPGKRMKLDMGDVTVEKSQSKSVPIGNAELGPQAQAQPASGQNPPLSAAALSFLEKSEQIKADAQRVRESRIAQKGS